jgi:hypothetical protein
MVDVAWKMLGVVERQCRCSAADDDVFAFVRGESGLCGGGLQTIVLYEEGPHRQGLDSVGRDRSSADDQGPASLRDRHTDLLVALGEGYEASADRASATAAFRDAVASAGDACPLAEAGLLRLAART